MCANCEGPFWPQSAFDDIFWRKVSREYPDMGASVLDAELDWMDALNREADVQGWEDQIRSSGQCDPLGQGIEDD